MADSSICRFSARSRSLHIRDPDEALFTLHDVTRQMDTRLAMGKRYFPAALTKQMLARSRPQVHERWAADDMISVADAATVVGAVPQEMRRWIAKGYCIGVKGPLQVCACPVGNSHRRFGLGSESFHARLEPQAAGRSSGSLKPQQAPLTAGPHAKHLRVAIPRGCCKSPAIKTEQRGPQPQ